MYDAAHQNQGTRFTFLPSLLTKTKIKSHNGDFIFGFLSLNLSSCFKRGKKKADSYESALCARRVIFPGRLQPSIFTVNELNY
ncbi:MAG: hypothetical protein KHY77_07865, partial [Butyricicoccus pullicaecorum]|nr:hypothetical protein [Butyricicoccus pullicaecorum]